MKWTSFYASDAPDLVVQHCNTMQLTSCQGDGSDLDSRVLDADQLSLILHISCFFCRKFSRLTKIGASIGLWSVYIPVHYTFIIYWLSSLTISSKVYAISMLWLYFFLCAFQFHKYFCDAKSVTIFKLNWPNISVSKGSCVMWQMMRLMPLVTRGHSSYQRPHVCCCLMDRPVSSNFIQLLLLSVLPYYVISTWMSVWFYLQCSVIMFTLLFIISEMNVLLCIRCTRFCLTSITLSEN